MPTLIVPSANLVSAQDTATLCRESVTGWLRANNSRLLMPTFRYGIEESKPLIAETLEHHVAQQIGAAIVGPRETLFADRLALAGFAFRNTKRRLPVWKREEAAGIEGRWVEGHPLEWPWEVSHA